MTADRTTISVYENAVPEFVGPALESLYGHVFASLSQFRIYDGIDGNTHTYVARDGDKATAVLLFICSGNQARVLNEQITIPASEISRFSADVFRRFPDVDTVIFPAICCDGIDTRRLAFPSQAFYRTEDIVLQLPSTADEYLAMLGKATRKNMKYHGNRLKRNFPSLRFQAYVDDGIIEQHVLDIVSLNRARMAAKNKTSEIDADETGRLIRLVRQGGLVTVMMLDGRVVAGTICSRIGANYFMHINAHNPAYDDARLGKLCCFMTICDCIARGGKTFHFMWGRFEYKYLFLGVQQDFSELVIYRSPLHMLRRSGSALRTAFNGYSREWKFRLLDLADRHDEAGPAMRVLARGLNTLRNLKRSGFAPAQKH